MPQDIADLESLELKVIWEYIGHDPPHNCRRTLDQFGYPALQDTNARDDDQMLYKLTKQAPQQVGKGIRPTLGQSASRRTLKSKVPYGDRKYESSGEETEYEDELDLRDGKVLMVDQLWLWAIDTSKFRPIP